MNLATAWALLPVLVVVLGFALRQHPARVVLAAAVAAGVVAGMHWRDWLETLGQSFLNVRYLLVIVLALPVIAQMEAHGLRELAGRLIAGWRGARPGRLLIGYLAVRQSAAAFGLTSLGGHAPMVRPLIAPMAEAAIECESSTPPSEAERERTRALCAATDNVGLFFGEDLFLAFGAVLLMQAFMAEQGIELSPLAIALWGIPTALCAFVIHAARLWWRDRRRP
ncbi:MAG: DUF969 domain-containing protein [Xanthomonadales bacterium]|nr:hypothetical protein [Xanthomonadales bacterium]MCC6594064.1 DUF969 domain-containing protein [Xanthomonadales bacterium]MCE7930894.1 DUF969 domain-containing protein [Xanthomonadales bacterium PRO6]